jgi:hypothetical protein
MCPVNMDVDSLSFFGINVAGNVRAFVDYKHAFSHAGGFPGKNRSVEAGADNQIIIFVH